MSPRILTTRFLGIHTKLPTFVSYASVDIPRHDIVCRFGDFNTKFRNGRSFSPKVLGQHGLVQRNENEELPVDLTLMNDLVMGGSLYTHRDVKKHS